MMPKITFRGIFLFVRENQRHVFVATVLIFTIFFHSFTFPLDAQKNDKASKSKSTSQNADLDKRHREKAYPNLLRSQGGDIFRIGAFIKMKEAGTLEVYARSSLNDLFKIGEWQLTSENQEGYRELLFSASDRYDDLVLRLKDMPESQDPQWVDPEVFIRSLSVRRLEIRNEMEKRNLEPTFFGLSDNKKEVLVSRKSEKNPQDRSDWIFQADGDFLEALEFAGSIKEKGRQEYIFELSRSSKEGNEKSPTILHRASFMPDAIGDLLTSSGNFRLPFSVPLERGAWYSISLVKSKKSSEDEKGDFRIDTLESDSDLKGSATGGDLALQMRSRSQTKNGASFPDGARLEDLGRGRMYSFSLEGESVDYKNIFNASSSIHFDTEKRLVVGNQKNGEFFIYKFDTALPYDRFGLQATQKGNDENEIKLEFSFDGVFWKEIPFLQEKGGSQKFTLTLTGDGSAKTVYIRTSYNGEEKKSGFFALDKLSVTAMLPKYSGKL